MAHRRVFSLVSLVIVSGLLHACGGASTLSELDRIPSVSGQLFVLPEGDVTGGQVTYTIYENGVITYHGDVSYNFVAPGMINVEFQPLFSGSYRAAPVTVKSKSYQRSDVSLREFKTVLSIAAIDPVAKTSRVLALAPQENVYGTLELDTSAATVRILAAEVTGPTPIGRLTLKLSATKPE